MSDHIEVRRSKRRKRTVSAYRQDERIVVLIPDHFTQAEETEWVAAMVEKVTKSERRRYRTDEQLLARAFELSDEFLGGRAVATSVRWVDNMKSRWGSCSVDSAQIRLSRSLESMPAWVRDYVLLHELAHLIEPAHNRVFWGLLDAYPKTEAAKAFLDGVVHGSRLRGEE